MAWTEPTTRAVREKITAAIWNADIVDNLNFLQVPNSTVEYKAAPNATTTSASFVDLDATNLSWSVTTSGGNMSLMFIFRAYSSSGADVGDYDFTIDGTSATGSVGFLVTGNNEAAMIAAYKTGLAAGAHTVRIQARRTGGAGNFGQSNAYKVTFLAVGT